MFEFLTCLVVGHRYYVVQEFQLYDSERVACVRCKHEWAVSHRRGQMLPWNSSYAEIMKDTGYVLIKPWK